MSDFENNPRSIKYHVKKFIEQRKDEFEGAKVIDFPAGNGVTSRILRNAGAEVTAIDLFPEYFQVESLTCLRADVAEGLPVDDGQADSLICQEGIEHFTDQINSMKEFNRVLRKGGKLIITTPNYSTIRAKLSYLLFETERIGKMMPPNENDTIWMSDSNVTDGVYYGHAFLIGIQRLRFFGVMAGFSIKHIQFTRLKPTSAILFPIFYPFIFLFATLTYLKNKGKFKEEQKKQTYKENYQLAINPRILVDGHLFVEFEKTQEVSEVASNLRNRDESFGIT